jgi:hypothetical protein
MLGWLPSSWISTATPSSALMIDRAHASTERDVISDGALRGQPVTPDCRCDRLPM